MVPKLRLSVPNGENNRKKAHFRAVADFRLKVPDLPKENGRNGPSGLCLTV